MYHQTIVLGNLGRDPEIRHLDSGSAVTNFSVAANNVFTKDGQQVEETTWYRISVFGNQAQPCKDYLSKGRTVLVVGRIRPDPETGGPRMYKRDDGSWSAQFELVAQSVKFVGGRPEGEAETQSGQSKDDFDLPF